MSKDITSIATPVLMSYQNIAAVANQQMDEFATHIDKEFQEKKLPEDYVKKTNQELFEKVEANNKIIYDIDQEILRRLKRDFPAVTTGGIMDSLIKKYREEATAYRKPVSKPVVKLKK